MGCAIAFQSSNSPPPSRPTICKMSDLFVAKKKSRFQTAGSVGSELFGGTLLTAAESWADCVS